MIITTLKLVIRMCTVKCESNFVLLIVGLRTIDDTITADTFATFL